MKIIAAGSNLPFCHACPERILAASFAVLGRIVRVKAVSRFYETPAWPDPAGPPYVNAVIQVETDMSAHALLAVLHAVEAGFGRCRTLVNGPRTLDLDLLVYEDLACDEGPGGLVVPHPRYLERAFVLVPLCDILPSWRPCPGDRSIGERLETMETGSIRLLS